MTQVRPHLAQFEGVWRVDRRIQDFQYQQDATFDGTAEFTKSNDGLLYVETGHLQIAGQPAMRAERRYFWRESDGQIQVFFDDDRFFHAISGDAPKDRHYCDPDFYDVTYDLHAWPMWEAKWRVTGPRKNYEMVSTYTRP